MMRLMGIYLGFSFFLMCSCCSASSNLKTFSKEDEDYKRLLLTQIKADNDGDSRLALARLNFDNHENAAAQGLLDGLIAQYPDNAEYRIWHGANRCKMAGEMFPWLLGMEKLYPVYSCLKEVDAGYALDPLNYPVLMVKLHTSYEVDMFGSMKSAYAAVQRFDEHLAKQGGKYAHSDLARYYYIAGLIAVKVHETAAAQQYFSTIVRNNADGELVAKAQTALKSLAQ